MPAMKGFALLVLAAFWVIVGLLGGAARAGDGIALIIGNNDYAHAPELRNARSDAKRIAKVMKGLGYDVIEAYDADARKMAEAMDEFADKVKSARIGLVYYAGHGIQYQGDAYLVPVDLDLNSERDLRKTVPADYLVSDAAKASELGIVILDACRDNPFVKQIAEDLGPTRSMAVGRGLSRINAAPARSLIAYATQAGSVALDGSGENSPYAVSLAEHLNTPNLDVRLIFGAVRDEVVKLTDGKQEPYVYGSLGGDEIYLSSRKGGNSTGGQGVLRRSISRTSAMSPRCLRTTSPGRVPCPPTTGRCCRGLPRPIPTACLPRLPACSCRAMRPTSGRQRRSRGKPRRR
jgi:hypothetical protein